MSSDDNDTRKIKMIRDTAQTHIVVAALLVTVTFAAGFTLPGGFVSDKDSLDKGMAILTKKSAFRVFVVADAIAFVCSAGAVFSYFVMAANHGPTTKQELRILANIYMFATILQVLSMSAVAIAFVTGLYATLANSVGLAAIVYAIGCLAFLMYLFVLHLIYKGLTGETTNQ